MPLVKVSELQVGQRIATDVSNGCGQIILPAGTIVSRLHSTLLKAWAVSAVTVEAGPEAGQPEVASEPSEPDGDEASQPAHPAWVAITTVASRVAGKAACLPMRWGEGKAGKPAGPEGGKPVGPSISAETIAAKAGNLASLPTIYARLERTINDPSSSAADITKILRNDQGLTARLLRIGNSAFYGLPRKVERLEEAVRIIGTRQLQDLVLGTVVLNQFKGLDAQLVSMRAFWRHSLACGIAARALAALRRERNTERFFVAGLLHDIGSLVLYQHVPERAQAALSRHCSAGVALEDAERAVIGCDHGAVGAAMMSLWKLPEFFKDTAASHHSSGHRPHTTGTAVVHLADTLVLALGLGSNGEARLPRFSADAWNLVGLETDCLEGVARTVMSRIEEAEAMFMDAEAAA